MPDDDRPASVTPGPRRRPATVIDLEATEVRSEPEAAVPPGDPPPQSPRDPQPEAAGRTGASPPRTAGRLLWATAGAGIAGGAVTLAALWLLWSAGALPLAREPNDDLGPRLAAIERQLGELSARRASPATEPKALDEIAARLGRLEAAMATPRPPQTDPVVLGRLSATENAVKSAADNMAGLSRRADAAEAALRAVNQRIDKLDAALAETQAAARQAAAGSDRASRLAIAVSALRGALERGDPFAAELAVVKPLAADAAAVSALEPFAPSGVPTKAALGRELAAALRELPRAQAQSGGGFLDRLAANAEQLVRVRPLGEARGDNPDAVIARLEQRAAEADIGGALAEVAKLPPALRSPLQAWVARAEARGKAIDAGRKLSADAVAALQSP